MQSRRAELKRFLKNLEIESYLDKLLHMGHSRKWVTSPDGRRIAKKCILRRGQDN